MAGCANGMCGFSDGKFDFGKLLKFSKWALILRGILFLLLSGCFFFRPVATDVVMSIVIGAYVLIEGVAMFIAAFKVHGSSRAMVFVNAVLLMLLGVFAISAPLMMAVVFITVIGVWQIFGGFECLMLPAAPGRKWLAVFSGILEILIGFCFVAAPLIGLLTLGWLIGALLLLAAVSMIALGIALK